MAESTAKWWYLENYRSHSYPREMWHQNQSSVSTTVWIWVKGTDRQSLAKNLHLMTERAHHWALRHRIPISHRWTLFISTAKCAGSDFIIWSNSENFPGRKKTFVRPNLKSTSFKPSALNSAYSEIKIASKIQNACHDILGKKMHSYIHICFQKANRWNELYVCKKV